MSSTRVLPRATSERGSMRRHALISSAVAPLMVLIHTSYAVEGFGEAGCPLGASPGSSFFWLTTAAGYPLGVAVVSQKKLLGGPGTLWVPLQTSPQKKVPLRTIAP